MSSGTTWLRRVCAAWCIAVALSGMSVAADPVERYVDAGWYGRSGNGAVDAPYGTIQQAIDAANAGDTIYVKPGTYDKGVKTASGYGVTNRVVVSKKLYIKSLGTASDTFIKGAVDPATGRYGKGAVRALLVLSAAEGSIIEGFTICDSAGSGNYNGENAYYFDQFGGGVHIQGANKQVYLVECVISNNWGYYGGGVYGGTLVRCLVSDNRSWTTSSACRGTYLWNCVIARNSATHDNSGWVNVPAIGEGKVIAVNCTIACNGGRGAANSNGGELYNCLFTANDAEDIITGSNHFNTPYNCFTSSNGDYPLMGPVVGDWRPQSGSAAVTGGRTSYLTDIISIPSEIAKKDFYGNDIDLERETCAIGAVQEPATPAAGGIYFTSGSSHEVKHVVDGNANFRKAYFFPDAWPTQICVRPVMYGESTREFYCYLTSGANTTGGANARYVQRDGNLFLTPPPVAGSVMTNDAISVPAANVLWCKPDADASIADGSYTKPYRTIQAAVDTRGNGTRCIINCLPGTYAEGGAEKFGASNRVAFAVTRSYLLRAVNGPDETFIEGAADANPTYPDAFPGCGSAAMRCICFHNYVSSWTCAVQGFTLRNGHSNALTGDGLYSEGLNTNTGVDGRGNRGGAIYGGGDSVDLYGAVQVLDCVITNCVAVRGAAADLAWLNRCRIYGGTSYYGVAVRGYATSCYFDDSNGLGTGYGSLPQGGVLGASFTTVHCTAPSASTSGSAQRLGDAYLEHTPGSSKYWGSAAASAGAATGLAVASPLFASASEGDWRVLSGTPALAALSFPVVGSSDWTTWTRTYATFSGGDIEGRRTIFLSGKPLPGAWQETASALSVAVSVAGVEVDGVPFSGERVLSGGETFVFSPDGTSSRYAAGIVVNGVTNMFADTGGTVSVVVGASPETLVVEPVVSPNWYVSPSGDDVNNNGFTAETPFGTLKKALSMCVYGDTVHAAPGRYESETMMPPSWESGGYTVRCRALVPSGVTLVGDGGADRTFIVGAPSTGADADTSTLGAGRGAGATRCVLMEANTTLRGFTLTGGRTDYRQRTGMSDADCAYHNDYGGAGVWRVGSGSRENILVEDCVFTNNVAYRGGGGRYATFSRCKFVGNYADYAAAGGEADFCQCLVYGNYGGTALYFYNNVESCTFGSHYKADGVTQEACINQTYDSGATLRNSIFKAYVVGKPSVTASHCMFISAFIVGSGYAYENCILTNSAAIAMDKDYRPVIGSNAGIDAADEALSPHCDLSRDFLGGQRVYNGRMDIGCCEADWRRIYAGDIASKRFEVTRASPGVIEGGETTVTVPEGACLEAVWTHPSSVKSGHMILIEVSEGGSLSVAINGETTVFAGGTHEFRYASALAADTLRFECVSGSAKVLSVRDNRMFMTLR